MRRTTIEEYVETIFVLERRDGAAHTGKIAEELEVKPPSVTEMLQKLQGEGYVSYKPFVGSTLTVLGRQKAEELMKRHKIIADFIEFLGVERERAEIDACRIEHHVSPETITYLEKFVEFALTPPFNPKWIDHFRYFIKTGERVNCHSCETVTEKGTE